MVATGPLRVFDGGDLAPQLDGVAPVCPLRGVGAFVVPAAVLQCDGEDVGQRVVECLARRVGVELLRIPGACSDHHVGVVAGVQHDRLHLIEVADTPPQPPRQIDRRLALVLRRVFLGEAVQDGALGFAGSR